MPFPMELCDRVVTLYRLRKGQVLRQVTKAFYHYKDVQLEDRFCREFLLVLPEEIPLLPGDRVFDGVGPEAVDWETFLPVTVPGLSQIGRVSPYRFREKFHHIEATQG